ncbi:MAG: patatin-like phospholipase family protein [Bacteroidales bacterium]|nr:patatin-like phospholipase family protein [Bacteroidales bacterium]
MKRLLYIIPAMLLSLSAMAQELSSAGFGLDPSDAAAVAYMRARSDSIRRHRPVVALVLSGGGAKGAATVGALKYMEKYDFPIDMVLGTSVGGLLGGLYSIGYSPEALETLIREIDWTLALSDLVDPDMVPHHRKAYKEKFALSFPFYYRHDDLLPNLASLTDGLFTSATAIEDATSLVLDNLISSLPTGVAYGENVNHIISSRTVGYSDSTDFFKFPIPFACVSTDLISGKAKVWHSGNINMALRATMSIPGLFTPVQTGGMLLVDGGMRNNFPVDIAKDLGADIVIGIELRDEPSSGSSNAKSIVNIVQGAIRMYSVDSFERSMASVDLQIKPDLRGFNMMSFDETAVEFMLLRGYKAAEACAQQLDSLKKVIGPEGFSLAAPPARDIADKPVFIDRVEITGLREKDANYVRKGLFIKDSSLVNTRILEDNVARIYGNGSFDFINYELLGKEEPYRLRIHCQKGPVHRFGLGLRVDSEEIVAALLNFGLNTNALRGPSLDMTAKIGSNPYLEIHGAMISPNIPSVHLRGKVRWTDKTTMVLGQNYYNVTFLNATQDLYLSNKFYGKSEYDVGISNTYHYITQFDGTLLVGDYNQGLMKMDSQSAFASVRMETLDNGYFPGRGVSAGVGVRAVADLFSTTHRPVFGIMSLDGRLPMTLGSFALIPQVYARSLIGKDIPLCYANVVGGEIKGRYTEQQIPFIGLVNAAFRRNSVAVGRVDARLRLGNSHFISAIGNVCYDFETWKGIGQGDFIWGAGLSYAYSSIVGPLKLTLHYNSLTAKAGAYFSLGFDF